MDVLKDALTRLMKGVALCACGRTIAADKKQCPECSKINMPIQQTHFGAVVWVDQESDALRRTNCLCRSCILLKTGGHPENCQWATALYKVCVDANIAVSITRCQYWQPLTP